MDSDYSIEYLRCLLCGRKRRQQEVGDKKVIYINTGEDRSGLAHAGLGQQDVPANARFETRPEACVLANEGLVGRGPAS